VFSIFFFLFFWLNFHTCDNNNKKKVIHCKLNKGFLWKNYTKVATFFFGFIPHKFICILYAKGVSLVTMCVDDLYFETCYCNR
jgi:hypothetical protein